MDIVTAHPTVTGHAPQHTIEGVIHKVVCSGFRTIEFSVENNTGQTVALYNNDFALISLTATGNSAGGMIYPCTDFEGMKARVQYVDSPDKTVNGQVTAVEMSK